MAGTYSQIYIHVIFAVKGRENLIHPLWEEELYKYITGIVQNKEQKMLAINGMSDHIHFLIGMRPSCCLSDLVREVKKTSTEFIRVKRLLSSPFQWQEGYGAFSYSHSSLNQVISYILNQKNIIERNHSVRSTANYWRSSKSNMILNICLNGFDKVV